VRFLGIDLAWKETNPSGVVVLEGTGFPLRLLEGPVTRPTHDAVLAWLRDWLARADPQPATVIGIDAPLLGVNRRRGRRDCDDVVSSAFGRFHASVHSFSAFRPMLRRFTGELRVQLGDAAMDPARCARAGHPAVREVYPNALQVHLFDLDQTPGLRTRAYKRHRFRSKREWVAHGLGPFVRECVRAIERRRYVRPDAAWETLVRQAPGAEQSGLALKALEDRWDALLCALAVALEHLQPGTMHAYTGGKSGAWRQGYILAPVLRGRGALDRGTRDKRNPRQAEPETSGTRDR
jgi:predicted RNase H-like nuclease